MEKYSCCICLCVYNNEKGLPAVICNLELLRTYFKNTQIIFYYDKSNDDSLEILQNFQKKYLNNNNNDNNIHILVNDDERSQSRTSNIAKARNELKN